MKCIFGSTVTAASRALSFRNFDGHPLWIRKTGGLDYQRRQHSRHFYSYCEGNVMTAKHKTFRAWFENTAKPATVDSRAFVTRQIRALRRNPDFTVTRTAPGTFKIKSRCGLVYRIYPNYEGTQ